MNINLLKYAGITAETMKMITFSDTDDTKLTETLNYSSSISISNNDTDLTDLPLFKK